MSPAPLRQQCAQIARLRHWLIRLEATTPRAGMRDTAERLEGDLVEVEDRIGAEADRLEPTATFTNRQWLAGLTTQVLR